jgi:hypothetical protein
MTREEYFKYGLKHKYINKIAWVYAILTEPIKDNNSNDFIKFDGKDILFKTEDDFIKIDGYDNESALLYINDKIHLTTDDIKSIREKDGVDTLIGRAITNYVLYSNPFDGKVPYMNEKIELNDVENNVLAPLLISDGEKNDGTKITIKELDDYMKAAAYLQNLAIITVHSATEKGVVGPPDIDKYAKKVADEMRAKYGNDVFTNFTRIAEFEKKLVAYDEEFLKDDPSYKKLAKGKILNSVRRQLFLSFGAEPGFSNSNEAVHVMNSLEKGWPLDEESLATIFNKSRKGSYSRGAETQKGGLTGKILLRATNQLKIIKGDCKSKLGKPITVTERNINVLDGRYMIEGGKVVELTLENKSKYMGKTITMRSPLYCLEKHGNFCGTCMGRKLGSYETGISLIIAQVGHTILYIAMAAMHVAGISTEKVDLSEAIT